MSCASVNRGVFLDSFIESTVLHNSFLQNSFLFFWSVSAATPNMQLKCLGQILRFEFAF